MYLYILRVSRDSFGIKLIKSLKDHPWHIVVFFCIAIYLFISSIFKICITIVLL